MFEVIKILTFLLYFQLVFRDNDLIAIPKEIGDLARLRELHIQGNRLTILPPELGKTPFIQIFIPGVYAKGT